MNKRDLSKATQEAKQNAVAEILEENPNATRAEITELAGIPDSTVWRILQKLKSGKSNGNQHIVYAWRWSGDDKYAKIGESTMDGLESRMVKTYHPTDDPILIAVMVCSSKGQAEENESYCLNGEFGFQRTRPDREWVVIDAHFYEVINDLFISAPNLLYEMFNGRIKTLRSG